MLTRGSLLHTRCPACSIAIVGIQHSVRRAPSALNRTPFCCEPLQAELRDRAIEALEAASGVFSLCEGAAVSALAAAGHSPVPLFSLP